MDFFQGTEVTAFEERVHPPVEVYDVCGFSMKYGSVLLQHHQRQTKGLRPFQRRSCHTSAQDTAPFYPQPPSFTRTVSFTAVPSGLAVFSTATGAARGYGVAQLIETLRYKPEGRGFHSRWCRWNFSLTSFRPHCGPGFDSASNRNEHQECFLGR